MKRRLALTVGVVAMLVVVAARPAGALPRAPERAAAPATSVPGNAIGLSLDQVAGTGLALQLDAGASQEHKLLVSNFTADLRVSVRLSVTDATGVLGAGPAAWVAFADEVVQLEPHAATSVAMTVAVPNATQPGPALVKVVATVESAVAAADGAPRTGTARVSIPVSIVVNGSATAQIAIVDVNRIDKDSQKQLAVVLRNFSNEKVKVDGNVRVASEHPQTLPLKAELAAARDTTVRLDWKEVPKKGVPLAIAIDVNYGNGDTASWSSTLGGPPTTLSQSDPGAAIDASTTTLPQEQPATIDDTAAALGGAPGKPWWKSGGVPMLIGLGVFLAAGWFVMEWRRSRRREETMPPYAVYPGVMTAAPGTDAAAELAKQLVRLTEIIVDLTTNHDGARLETRVRGPDPPADDRGSVPARAGPRADDRGLPVRAGDSPTRDPDAPAERESSSAPEAPGTSTRSETPAPVRGAVPIVVARPEPEPEPEREPAPDPPSDMEADEEPDPRESLLERLRQLDRGRRELRQWMDEEAVPNTEGGESIPGERTLFSDRPDPATES